MESLKKISGPELNEITTPSVINIILNIKKIQVRMKDPDVVNLAFIDKYTILTNEFTEFAERYGSIFTKVVNGDDLSIVAQILYYKDKEARGIISEEKIVKMVSDTYLSDEIKTMIKDAEEKNKSV